MPTLLKVSSILSGAFKRFASVETARGFFSSFSLSLEMPKKVVKNKKEVVKFVGNKLTHAAYPVFSVDFKIEMGFGRALRYQTFRLRSLRDRVVRAGASVASKWANILLLIKLLVCL